MTKKEKRKAVLLLQDGTLFEGFSIGKVGTTTGELCFNTGMTGYQEILTDPSYCRQIVTLTYPHIGNYGVNATDFEFTATYYTPRGDILIGVVH